MVCGSSETDRMCQVMRGWTNVFDRMASTMCCDCLDNMYISSFGLRFSGGLQEEDFFVWSCDWSIVDLFKLRSDVLLWENYFKRSRLKNSSRSLHNCNLSIWIEGQKLRPQDSTFCSSIDGSHSERLTGIFPVELPTCMVPFFCQTTKFFSFLLFYIFVVVSGIMLIRYLLDFTESRFRNVRLANNSCEFIDLASSARVFDIISWM